MSFYWYFWYLKTAILGPWKSLKSPWILSFQVAMNPGCSKTETSDDGWLCAVRPGPVQDLRVKTRSGNSTVNTVMFRAPAHRSMTYNIIVTCDQDGFQLVSWSFCTLLYILVQIVNVDFTTLVLSLNPLLICFRFLSMFTYMLKLY